MTVVRAFVSLSVRMRIAGWRYYELMVGTDETLATKHDTHVKYMK